MSIAINKTTPLIPITSIGCKHVNKSRDIMHFNPCTQTNGMTIMDCRYTLLFSVRSVHFKDLARTSDNPAIYFTFHSTRLVYKHSEQNHYLHWTTMGRAFSNWKIAVSILPPPPKTNSFCSLLSVYFHREMGLFYYYYYCYY